MSSGSFVLDVNGARLNVYDSGNEKKYENSTALVFLHGTPGQISNWKYQIGYFKKYYRTIVYDQRGFGASDKPKKVSLNDYLLDLEELLRKLDVNENNAILIGHSFGGIIVQEFAASHKVKGIVLVGSLLRLAPDIFDKVIWYLPSFLWKPVLFKMNPLTLKLYRDMFFSENVPDEVYEDFVRDNKDYIESLPAHVFRYLKYFKDYDASSSLKRISLPTLIIVGMSDKVTPVEYSVEINQLIPGSRLEIIEDAEHMVIIEKYSEVNRLIHDFTKSIEA